MTAGLADWLVSIGWVEFDLSGDEGCEVVCCRLSMGRLTGGVEGRESVDGDLDDPCAVDEDARCDEVLVCGLFFGIVGEGVEGSDSLDEELDDFGAADGDEYC